VTERLLVGLRHPEVERARVEVGAQAARVGAFGAPADAVGVHRVLAAVEPLDALRLALPLAVEEGLDGRHTVTLPGLHLGPGPVDRIDLRLGADAAEEVV